MGLIALESSNVSTASEKQKTCITYTCTALAGLKILQEWHRLTWSKIKSGTLGVSDKSHEPGMDYK